MVNAEPSKNSGQTSALKTLILAGEKQGPISIREFRRGRVTKVAPREAANHLPGGQKMKAQNAKIVLLCGGGGDDFEEKVVQAKGARRKSPSANAARNRINYI